jgi:hypothetical protein
MSMLNKAMGFLGLVDTDEDLEVNETPVTKVKSYFLRVILIIIMQTFVLLQQNGQTL